jgi:hypothetical protein
MAENEEGVPTFISEVVTQAENELGRISRLVAIFQNKPLCNLALVHEPGSDFKIGFAGHDFHVVLLRNSPLQVFLTFASLERTVLWISTTIMPCECDLLAFGLSS